MSTSTSELDRQQLSRGKKETDSRSFGDSIGGKKKKDLIRIMFQNIRGLGYTKRSPKTDAVKKTIVTSKTDIMMIAEVNVNWERAGRRNSFKNIGRHWFNVCKTSCTFNTHQIPMDTKWQPGGHAIISRDEVSRRVNNYDHDTRRMGRWSSQVVQGKEGKKLRVVSVYVPSPTKEYTNQKIFCQQQDALLKLGITGSVVTVFWNDWWEQIDKWRENGDTLVIGGDWNTDVREEAFQKPFRERNLIPAMYTRHGPDLPATHNAGKLPIDEMFVSDTIEIKRAGYLEHGHSSGDHRPVWIDVTKRSTIGTNLPPITSFSARKLKCTDPRVVEKYNDKLKELLIAQGYMQRLEKLVLSIEGSLSDKQAKEYEALDQIRSKAMKDAENVCRRIFHGAVGWCPKFKQARDKVQYIKLSLSKKKGRKVGARVLMKLAKKTNLNTETMTMKSLEDYLQKAYKEYKALKKNHEQNRKDYIEDLATELEKRKKGKKAKLVRHMINTEENRRAFSKIAHINHKTQDLNTTFVTYTDKHGQVKEVTDKREMEQTIMQENVRKYHQTEATCPFMRDPLRNHFGDYGIGPATEMLINGTYVPPEHETKQTKLFLETCSLKDTPQVSTEMTRTKEEFRDT